MTGPLLLYNCTDWSLVQMMSESLWHVRVNKRLSYFGQTFVLRVSLVQKIVLFGALLCAKNRALDRAFWCSPSCKTSCSRDRAFWCSPSCKNHAFWCSPECHHIQQCRINHRQYPWTSTKLHEPPQIMVTPKKVETGFKFFRKVRDDVSFIIARCSPFISMAAGSGCHMSHYTNAVISHHKPIV